MRSTCWLLLITVIALQLSRPADCMPRDRDDKQFAREKVKIAAYATKKDIPALMQLLHSKEFRSSELAAYWLGRLGAKQALSELQSLHERNRNLACPPPSGVFGAAAARIRVSDLPLREQVAQLLDIALDVRSDLVLASEVGRILIDYDDARILPTLRGVRTYGAQETVVRLGMKDRPKSCRMAFLVETLVEYESPQRAEAAEILLKEAGTEGATAVMQLLNDRSWEKKRPSAKSTKNRAYHIVSATGTEEQKRRLSTAGWKWGRPVTPVIRPKPAIDVRRMKDAIGRLSNQDYLVRFKAAMELRDMPLDERAVPALKRAANDPEVIVQRASLEALTKIDSAKVVPIMVATLQSKRREFRYLAAEALWRRGVKRGVRVFVADLRSDDPEVRAWADRHLERLTGITTNYWYGDPPDEREQNVRWWEMWISTQPR